jgi:aminoglycoside N3'-acetyltransferase
MQCGKEAAKVLQFLLSMFKRVVIIESTYFMQISAEVVILKLNLDYNNKGFLDAF